MCVSISHINSGWSLQVLISACKNQFFSLTQMSNMYVDVAYFHKQAASFIHGDMHWSRGVARCQKRGSQQAFVLFYSCLVLPRLQTYAFCYVLAVCTSVCSAERHGLLLSLFQEWIPWGLQELLNEMEGSGQEWWEGKRGGRLLHTLGGFVRLSLTGLIK